MTSVLYLGSTTPSPLSVPNSHRLPCFDLDLGNLPPSLLTSFMIEPVAEKQGNYHFTTLGFLLKLLER